MLRASSNYHGLDDNLRAVTEGATAGDSGVVHGEQLIRFAEAAVRSDATAGQMYIVDLRIPHFSALRC